MAWFGQRNPYEPPHADLKGPRESRSWTREQIYETVADCLIKALGVDRDEIRPEATLARDLGAE
jgi:hypothetical protein